MKKWIPLIIAVLLVFGIGIASTLKGDKHESGGSQASGLFDRCTGDSDTTKLMDPHKIQAHIYVDNSGSMDGFVSTNSEFKDVIENLMVMLNNKCSTPKASLISDSIVDVDSTQISSDVTKFARSLAPKRMKVGKTSSTDINEMFQKVLDKTKENTVSILITDGVYSIAGNDSRRLLTSAKNLTKNAFMQAIRRDSGDLSVLILQCQSDYNGTYYNMYDQPVPYVGKRPYYVIIAGKTDCMKSLDAAIDLTSSDIKGLMNTFRLSSKNTAGQMIFITAENLAYNTDRIVPLRGTWNIDNIRLTDTNQPFGLVLGIDKVDYYLDGSYLSDASNYEISPSSVKIKNIGSVDRSSSAFGDVEEFKSPYFIQLDCKGMPSFVKVSLLYKVPEWGYRCSTEDDSQGVPPENVTFGISYLLEGINEAVRDYNKINSNIFDFQIEIKNYD